MKQYLVKIQALTHGNFFFSNFAKFSNQSLCSKLLWDPKSQPITVVGTCEIRDPTPITGLGTCGIRNAGPIAFVTRCGIRNNFKSCETRNTISNLPKIYRNHYMVLDNL